MTTDLRELIKKNDDDINLYLGEVSSEDFKEDVLNLINKYADKGAIKEAIESLQKLL